MGARNIARLLSGENVTLVSATTVNTTAINATGAVTISGAATFSNDLGVSGELICSNDVTMQGITSADKITWDQSTSEFLASGYVRSDLHVCPKRYGLIWIAGKQGVPAANADAASDTGATSMAADHTMEIVGTNATTGDATQDAEGGVKIETDGADHDEVIICPHLDSNMSAWTGTTWGNDESVEWECDITSGASIATCMIWAGLKLTNTDVVITDADQCFFRYQNGVASGKWVCIDSNGGTDNETTTAVTVAVDTRYHLKICISVGRIPTYYINGVLVATGDALKTGVDLIPYIAVSEEGASAARHILVHSAAISRNIGAA